MFFANLFRVTVGDHDTVFIGYYQVKDIWLLGSFYQQPL